MKNSKLLPIRVIALALMFAGLIVSFIAAEEFVMDSAYVDFFGIQPDSGTADPDSDSLSNYEESQNWTDPFVADTDKDLWRDVDDINPVSRAFTPWGSPFFNHPDGSVLYTWPLWMQAAWADGGFWLTNIPYGWNSPVSETNSAALYMEVDRSGIESNLVLRIDFLDHANSALYLDLFDTNDTVTASALYGNLLSGTGTETNRILEVPFAANPAATGIRLRKGAGDITILSSLLYVDADLDGLDADQEAQLGTSDYLADSDGDGLSDYDEVFIHGTNPANPDADGDGIGDGIELRMGLDPLVAGNYSALPFTETFEPPAVTAGELSGQNNWEVNIPGVAIVQTNEVFTGLQALKLANDAETNAVPVIRHLFADAPSVVWMDIRQKVFAAAIPTNMPDAAAFLLFNEDGHLVVSDGNRPAGQQFVTLTNAPATAQGEWARISMRSDYDSQTWLVCLNGYLVADNLGFSTPQERFTAINIEGQSAVMDDMYVGASQPGGLSTVPGNRIPDDWYLLHIGSLGSDDADPDGDGLTNLQEYQLGTHPNSADTDGDGISDQSELQLGRNPLIADTLSVLPFAEGFELPAVTAGELSGQNNWIASRTGMAIVQTSERLSGEQALKLLNEEDDTPVSVNHVFTDAPAVVWVDIHQQAIAAALPETIGQATTLLCFNSDGYLVVLDGSRPLDQRWVALTNMPAIAQGEWARITMQLDYDAQTWIVCLNGILAAENLGFASPKARLQSVSFDGQSAVMDDIYVGAAQPAALSLDGDSLPDDWELLHFGHLDHADDSDPDGDSLTNLQEYRLGTNPANPDTDGDGLPDGYEAQHGLDPLASADASGDLDGDGLTNLEEYMMGTQPDNPDTDGDGLNDGWEVQNGLNPLSADTDGDGMPDGWELQIGLSPLDASDAALDADSDGLTNLQEYQLGTNPNSADTDGDGLSDGDEVNIHGTNPLLADSDGDGMPDGWEVLHGFNPLNAADAASDPDADGLTNLHEFRNGTNPLLADTDGDGLADGEEVHYFRSNPLVADFDGTVTDLLSSAGSATTATGGSWSTDGTSIHAQERNGWLDYTVDFPQAGTFALAFSVTQRNALTTQGLFDLTLYVDGMYCGRRQVTAPYGTTATAIFILPELPAGPHTARLVWRNIRANTFLQVNSLTLRAYNGPDADGNGIADWIESRLAALFDVETLPQESIVSPVCLEGTSEWIEQVAVIADYAPDGAAVQQPTVRTGIRDGWYADVHLSPTNDTLVAVSGQAESHDQDMLVTWAPLNLFADHAYTNGLPVRTGSSLLLAALPQAFTNGTAQFAISLNGSTLTNAVMAADAAPLQYRFVNSGTYLVTAAFASGETLTNAALTVSAVHAAFPMSEIVTVAGTARTLDAPAIPTNIVLQADPALQLTAVPRAAGGTTLTVNNIYDNPLGIVARLGENGPVLDSTRVATVYGDRGTYWRVTETYPDGSRLVMVRLQLGNVPENIRVVLDIFVGGVVFLDGTRKLTLTAADFDDTGSATYYMIQGAAVTTSTCHRTYYYDGDVRIK